MKGADQMDVKHIFAVRLKALREELGMSQNQLAKELDISRGSISFYENGQRTALVSFEGGAIACTGKRGGRR